MFVQDINDMCVMAWARCGHTSMYRHFNIELYSLKGRHFDKFIDSKANTKIVVVRNPYDRLLSAINNTKALKQTHEWTLRHSKPLLRKLDRLEFDYKIIDFYRLKDYIQVARDTIVTNSNASSSWSEEMRGYYTQEEMLDEYVAYKNIMSTREQLTTDAWKNIPVDN